MGELMKRKHKYLWCLIALLVLMTGCMPNKPISENEMSKMEIENKEWVDAIGLLNRDSAPFSGFDETDSEINVELMCDNGVSSYEDVCEVVNAHNKFVDENPTYFNDDITINFTCEHTGQSQSLRLFNQHCSFYGFEKYEEYLKRSYTSKIQYAYVQMARTPELAEMSNKFNVPVVILGALDVPAWPSDDHYKVLNGFKNLELVVIDYYSENMEYDPAEVYNTIQKYAPGVKVFDVRSLSYVN